MATYKDCLHFAVCDRCPNCKPDECEFFMSEKDVVEVVRCKDCVHKVDYCGRLMCGRLKYEFKDGVGGLVATVPEHFCSYGERRDT